MFRSTITASVAVACLAIIGCETFINPIATDSGIMGVVQAGPTCPVVRPGVDCADKPIVATVIVRYSFTGLEATQFTSDADGTFRVALSPGTYILEPQPAGYIATPPPQTVDVQAHQFADIVIQYDTGIR